MKKLACIATVVSAVMMMGSCGQKSQQVPFDNGDSLRTVNMDPTVFGVCGEATAMNTLQLITDTGDTLMLDISAAQEANQVFGGLQTGDRMAVIPTKDKRSATLVINQAALMGNWVMPNPLDGSDEVGISIKEGGIAESIAQSSIVYKTWRLVYGKLEIVSVREGGGDEEEVGLYTLMKLTPDSLTIKLDVRPEDMQPGERDVDNTMMYSRQKEKEHYDVQVDLEDSGVDDFIM